LFRILGRLKAHLWSVGLVIVLLVGRAVLDLWLPDLMAKVIEQIGVPDSLGQMLIFGGEALGVAAGSLVLSVAISFLTARIAMSFGRELRAEVFAKIESFSLQEFDRFSTSSLITRCTNDIQQVVDTTIMMLRMIISAPIMLIGGLVMALQHSSRLTLVLAVSLPLMIVLVVTVVLFALPLFRIIQSKVDALTQVTREGLTGVRVIRAFDNDAVQTAKFDRANTDLTRTSVKVNRIMAVMMPTVNLIFSLTAVAIYWFGAKSVSSITDIANMSAVMQYAFRIMMSFMMMAMVLIMVPRAQVSAKRMTEVLDTVPRITSGGNAVSRGAGEVTFRDVTFRFSDDADPVVEHISFTARPGTTTAIIGGTGSGKSTILNLLTRFYDPQEGEILLDGVNIKTLDLEALRNRLGYVPQQAVLFSGTIAENLRYGKPDAAPEELQAAARVAQIDGFVEGLQGGYGALVAQGGKNFSGGQKQRLCIARAVVRRPDAYLFDDSFSALDYRTDAAVRSALKAECANATRIIVAQRVGTILDADTIIVLNNGAVAGQGTHHDLMQTCPAYCEIVRSQFKEGEIA
jgi:ATP-binding cassette subfamily B protein